LRDEVIPKNILMMGPTGVGKTEIARRLARLANAPFVKVEATKFTEVGYVGRDVDSMVRDLVQIAVRMVEQEQLEGVKERADELAVDRIVDSLQPQARSERGEGRESPPGMAGAFGYFFGSQPTPLTAEESEAQKRRAEQTDRIRARLREQVLMGVLDDRRIE